MLWIVLVMRLFRLTDRENSTPSPRQAAITFFVPNAESPRAMIVASGSIALAVVIACLSWRAGPPPAPGLPPPPHPPALPPARPRGGTAGVNGGRPFPQPAAPAGFAGPK